MFIENGPQFVVNARFLTQSVTGVQRFAIELCLHLKGIIPNIVFVSPHNIIQKDIAKKLEVECYGHFTSHFWEQIELPRFLKQKGSPVLLNFCNTAPLFYKKGIVCIHDIAFHINPKWFSTAFAKLYEFLIPRIAQRSLKVITVSNFSKKSISNYTLIPEDKIEVVYNSVSDLFFNPSLEKNSSYGNYVLAVSSIDPRKNLLFLIKAFKQLNEENLKLVIVGGESKVFADAALKEEIKDCSSIVFSGYVTDAELAALYKNAIMFVYPSLYEGFGLPPLEAMACGCPTIVAETSSLPEILGEASLYVNPFNIEELVTKIKLLYTDAFLRKKLQLKGYEQVKLYSWEQSALKLAAILRQYQ